MSILSGSFLSVQAPPALHVYILSTPQYLPAFNLVSWVCCQSKNQESQKGKRKTKFISILLLDTFIEICVKESPVRTTIPVYVVVSFLFSTSWQSTWYPWIVTKVIISKVTCRNVTSNIQYFYRDGNTPTMDLVSTLALQIMTMWSKLLLQKCSP